MGFALLVLLAGCKGISPAHAGHKQIQADVPVDCTLTGGPIYGSTRTLNEFRNEWWHTGTVPNLPHVKCPPPIEIIGTSVLKENIGVGNAYSIRLELLVNTDAPIGRYDIGGLTVPCYSGMKGLGNYKHQIHKGDVSIQLCFSLGDKYFDAYEILNEVQSEAVLCRVVFLDEFGAGGEYSHTWFNNIPQCDVYQIFPDEFCRDKYHHPNHVDMGVCN